MHYPDISLFLVEKRNLIPIRKVQTKETLTHPQKVEESHRFRVQVRLTNDLQPYKN